MAQQELKQLELNCPAHVLQQLAVEAAASREHAQQVDASMVQADKRLALLREEAREEGGDRGLELPEALTAEIAQLRIQVCEVAGQQVTLSPCTHCVLTAFAP